MIRTTHCKNFISLNIESLVGYEKKKKNIFLLWWKTPLVESQMRRRLDSSQSSFNFVCANTTTIIAGQYNLKSVKIVFVAGKSNVFFHVYSILQIFFLTQSIEKKKRKNDFIIVLCKRIILSIILRFDNIAL